MCTYVYIYIYIYTSMASVAMLLERSRPSEAPRILSRLAPVPRPSEALPMEQIPAAAPMADLRGPSSPTDPGALEALAGQPQGDQGPQGLQEQPPPPPPEGPQEHEEPVWHLGWDDLPLTSLGILKALEDPRFEFLEHNYRAQLVDLQKREINKTPKKN